jgi:hypothetical protein
MYGISRYCVKVTFTLTVTCMLYNVPSEMLNCSCGDYFYTWRGSLRFSIDLIPSGRVVVLGWTKPLTKMRTRVISCGGGKCGRCVGLTPSCADFLEILAASTSSSPTGLFRPV